jgi:nucleotide-binding universal stress UspA family protein
MPTIEDPGQRHEAQQDDTRLAHDPLTSLEAERAREDALRRASERWMNPMISSAHGRVEEETRRLTERMAREEWERRHPGQRQAKAPTLPTSLRPAVQRVEGRRLPVGAPIKRILLALDGSLFAERALPYTEALARMTGAEIVVGSSTDRADLAHQAGADLTHATGGLSNALIRARARITTAGLRATARMTYGPTPADGILALQYEVDATVLAVASHVRRGSDRALAGTMVEDALRKNWAYTLVTPSGAADLLDKRCAFRRILVPLDGSKAAESALAVLTMLLALPAPEERPRRVTLLFVATSHAQEADGGAYLHEIQAAAERETGIHGTVFTRVAVGSPSSLIIEEASGAHSPIPSVARYDLTLMATHPESTGNRWILGSVPLYALTHGDSPTLFVRAPQDT